MRAMKAAALLLIAWPASAAKLGGGYRQAQWGATPTKVQSTLAAAGFGAEGKTIDFPDGGAVLNLAKGKEHLRCEFFQGGFYRVVFKPGLTDGDQDGAEEILKILAEKYGPGSPIEGYTDESGAPLRIVGWDDGESTIEAWMTDPAPAGRPKPGIYPSSTLRVIYTGKQLAARKNAADQAAKARRAQDEKQKKEAALKDEL